MLRYFVAGNIWLLLSLAIFANRLTFYRSNGPSYYSIQGLPRLFSSVGYGIFTCVPVVASAVCFILYWKTLPAAPFRFDTRTMLVVVAVVALVLAIIVAT